MSFLARPGRPRILYVIQQEDYSGAELMHLPVLRADPDPLLACPPGSRTEQMFAAELGLPTVPLPFRPLRHSDGLLTTLRSVGRGLRTALDLRRVLRAHPERAIIYCTSMRPALVASLASIGLGRRVLWTICEFQPPAPLRQAVHALAWLRCHRALAHSHAVERDFVGRSRRLARRTRVAYLPGVAPDSDQLRPLAPGRQRAAIVGSVTPRKRVELAIEAARLVGAEVPEFELLVIGRGQFRPEDLDFDERLRTRVAASPELAERIRFVGHSRDVPALLAQCGLLLHCCDHEPLGSVLIEAMDLGLPIVAPNAGGPGEIIVHGTTGFLFPPGNARAAADAVLRLLREPGTARAMSEATRSHAARHFGAQQQLSVVEGLLAEFA